MSDRSHLTLVIPPALHRGLVAEADRRMTTKSAIIRELIAAHLSSLRPNQSDLRDTVAAPQHPTASPGLVIDEADPAFVPPIHIPIGERFALPKDHPQKL